MAGSSWPTGPTPASAPITTRSIRATAASSRQPHARRGSCRLVAGAAGGVDVAARRDALNKPDDLSASIKLTLAGLIQRIPPAKRGELVAALVAVVDEYADPYLPLMTWYALAPVV